MTGSRLRTGARFGRTSSEQATPEREWMMLVRLPGGRHGWAHTARLNMTSQVSRVSSPQCVSIDWFKVLSFHTCLHCCGVVLLSGVFGNPACHHPVPRTNKDPWPAWLVSCQVGRFCKHVATTLLLGTQLPRRTGCAPIAQ